MAQSKAGGKAHPLSDGTPVTTEFYEGQHDEEVLQAHSTPLNHYKHKDQNLIFVGAPKPVVDKFACTLPIKSKEDQVGTKANIMYLKESMHCKKVNSTTYDLSFSFGLTDQSAVLVQAAPYSHGMNFLRLEFNPAKIGETGADTLVGQILPVLFPHGIPAPRITRFHVAVDFKGVKADGILLYAPGFRKHQSFYASKGGVGSAYALPNSVGSQYAGSHTSDMQIVIYDKQAEAKLAYPCTRVEFKYEPSQGTTFDALRMMNLFAKVKLYRVQALEDITSHELAGFLAYVREFGFSGAKKVWPKALFGKLLSQLETFELWKPGHVEFMLGKYKAEVGRLESLLS